MPAAQLMVRQALLTERSAAADSLVLACALEVERRIARGAGARSALVGLGAGLPLPEGRLVSFGVAGGLTEEFRPGMLLTAERVVDVDGAVLWEGEPLRVGGAEPAVICWSPDGVVNEPEARKELARRSGASAVDMESGVLARSGRLAGVVRAISDDASSAVEGLDWTIHADGRTNVRGLVRWIVTQRGAAIRTIRGALRALKALEEAVAA
jgi:hypothetical protein